MTEPSEGRAASGPRLVVTEPAELVGRVFELSGAEVVIGHSDTADLVLDDSYVSRRHALITFDAAGQATLRDLNSMAGTELNGQPLVGGRVLGHGDLIRFADLLFRFEAAGSAAEGGAQDGAQSGPTTVPASESTEAWNPPPATGSGQRPGPGSGTATDPDEGSDPGAGAGTGSASGTGTSTAEPGDSYTVTGTVASTTLPGVGGLSVELVDKNVGGDQVLGSTETASDGSYAFTAIVITARHLASFHKTRPDLQTRALIAGAVAAQSTVSYSAPAAVTLDIVLPPGAAGLPSEYELLTANLAAVYPGTLGDLKENADQQDITYLANKTGWDARAVALAALADQLGQLSAPQQAPVATDPAQTQVLSKNTVSLAPQYYYALLRAGLPADQDTLFQTSGAQAQAIWQQAAASGVMPAASADAVTAAVTAFQTLKVARSLAAPPAIGLSTLQEMLAPTLAQRAQQQTFARLLTEHEGDWRGLWAATEQALGNAVSNGLQLAGQLYYLTVNNAPLVSSLLAASANAPLGSTKDLVGRGLYEAGAWSPLIGANVPPGFPGADATEQAGNYAEFLAAQVRASYPTAVLADQVGRGVFPLPDNAQTVSDVASFLDTHQADFVFGVEPVDGYLARNPTITAAPAVLDHVRRLQRTYQITPDDTSMTVLLQHNLDSAFAVTRYDADGFTRKFAAQLGGTDQAAAVHRRARQVFSGTLGTAMAYLNARTSVDFGGRSPVQTGTPAPSAPPTYPVTAYATLESLFGSLDYCSCSDCNSVLSAAAYLVDLLNYLDQPAPTDGFPNPQDVLLDRRPDLQDLPLTCANTNTALPAIDLVNELLEYVVANGLSITGYPGHDTGATVTSAELIAAPQYVNDGAYTVLQSSYFPPPLPFTRPLALLRLHFQHLNVALPDAMAALRSGEQLVNTQTSTSYGWQDVLLEALNISRDELRVLTDPDGTVQLGDLYGLPDATAAATLQATDLQDFTRRVGVSYDDLAAVLQTQFINPNAYLIPLAEQLGAPFATLKTLHDNLGTSSSIALDFINALPAGLDATAYGGTSPTDYQAVVDWVTGAQIYPLVMSLVTITNPTGDPGDCSGTSLFLAYSNPDPTAAKPTATEYLKLIRFIRFWQKLAPLLGEPTDAAAIQQTDAIISALYPAAQLPQDPENPANDNANRTALDQGFAVLLRRAGFLFQLLDLLGLSAETSLARLLACWAPIGTSGSGSLYQSMFLTPALLQQDPGAQTATVSPAVNTGDVLTTLINGGSAVPAYTVTAGQSASAVATAIAASINASTTPDPATGLPLNDRFHAVGTGGTVTITAGFTFACSTAGGTATYTAGTVTPLSATATVAGTVAAGETLNTTIDGVAIGYTTVAGDTPATIATAIAAVVNATSVLDPYAGQPLNSLITASSAADTVTVTAVNAGAPFTLACQLAPANAGTYKTSGVTPPSWTATIGGAVSAGDVLTTTVNQIAVAYTATSTDTSASVLATSIAAAINGATQLDPQTGLALGAEVRASAAGNVVSIHATESGASLTVSCAVSHGAETYTAAGPLAAKAEATVAGTIPAGVVLTTTIGDLPVAYQARSGDTPSTIATAIAAAVNACTLTDPASALPLNQLVTASASGATVTLTGASTTTTFTLSTLISESGYTAGRAAPPFAATTSGTYLTDPTQTLFGHEPTLCAACNLTGAEFALITAELGYNAATPLTQETVSTLFRYGWFAHALGSSVLEFLQLRRYSGLDPFAPLDPGTSAPVPPTAIRFVRLSQALSAAGLSCAQALYLIWNQDNAGTFSPPTSAVTSLATALSADFAAVEAQFTVTTDPDGSIAKSLMTLVYGASATDFYFGLLSGTFATSVPYSVPAGQDSLPAAVVTASGGLLTYDDLAKQLSYTGVLNQTVANAIDGAATDPAMPAAIAALLQANQQATGPFFATYPELLPLYTAYAASTAPVQAKRQSLLNAFLPVLKAARKQEQALAAITAAAGTDPAFASALLQDATVLHADADPTLPAIDDLTAVENPGLSARFYLDNDPGGTADTSLPVVPGPGAGASTIAYWPTATLGGTPSTGETLTTTVNGVAVSYSVAATDTSLALLAAGVAAAINASTAPVTVPDPLTTLSLNRLVNATADGPVVTLAGLDPSSEHNYFTLATSTSGGTTTYTAGSQLPAGSGSGGIAATWSGYLTVAQDGFYDIDIAADPTATISLLIGGVDVLGPPSGGLWSNSSQIRLAAGTPVPVILSAQSLKTTLSISWLSQGQGWQPLPVRALTPQDLVDRLGDTYTRFLKATTLAGDLSLTADETAYLAAAPTWSIATTDATTVPAGASAVFTPASTANIAIGTLLVVDEGAAQETVTVTAVTATTFTAASTKAHDGTSTPFAIVRAATPALSAGWLNFLAVQGAPAPATAGALAELLTELLDFAAMKQALSPGDERLLAVLQNPAATLAGGQSALVGLTGWNQSSINALLTRFFGSTDPAALGTVPNLRRLYDAYAYVTSTGLSAAVLLSAVTNSPTPDTVSALQSALRAQYAEADWLSVIQPVNDAARTAQRDALVAYVVQRLGDQYAGSIVNETTTAAAGTGAGTLKVSDTTHVTAGMLVQGAGVAAGTAVHAVPTPGTVTLSAGTISAISSGAPIAFVPAAAIRVTDADSLYDYFLLDTQVEPPVLTSRVLQALSTTQLFVERVLRNLEPSVSPTDIDATRWQWMKRYRVWQANREVFLWPENWLYPELRPNQSPFFQQMMTGLLQGDITDDAATSAYLSYLTNLEEVAKLEPCGLYYQPATADTDETAYVIARTAGSHRKHYFRELSSGAWTPWTEVQIECEDLPITPIVWNGRLFLFWLKTLKTALPQEPKVPSGPLTGKDLSSIAASDLLDFPKTSGVDADSSVGKNSVQVQAQLHWIEYYNGSWQRPKTSDLNRPTTIGTFDAAGPGSFEAQRGLLRIIPVQYAGVGDTWHIEILVKGKWEVGTHGPSFTVPEGALVVGITSGSTVSITGGFLLHNTHSLPVRFEDMPLPDPQLVKKGTGGQHTPATAPFIDVLPQPAPARTFPDAQPYSGGYGPGTFTINYLPQAGRAATWTNPVLDYSWMPRWTDVQPGLADAWDAPFLYEDRRNVFYVTTAEAMVPVLRYNGYGVRLSGLEVAEQAPAAGLVLRDQAVLPAVHTAVAANAAAGGAQAVRRYLSTSTTINAALSLPAAVSYDGLEITPAGGVPAPPEPPSDSTATDDATSTAAAAAPSPSTPKGA